jgi:2-dehydropantoate 2-reductase
MLMTKAYDARWMAELIKPYLAEDGLLIGAQNSMTAGDLAEIVGRDRTLGCVVELSSNLFIPGIVTRNTPPERTWFAVGALDAAMDHRVPEVVEIFEHIGKVSVADDIVSAKWMKLIVNSMTMAIRSIMGMTSGEMAQIPSVRELILRTGEEALAAGQASGYKIVPIFGLSPEQIEGSNRLLETLIDKLRSDVRVETKNAMYQDILKGRRTEIDMLNGLVCDLGRRHGVATPVNEVLVDITHKVAAGELKQEAENFDRVLAALKARGAER